MSLKTFLVRFSLLVLLTAALWAENIRGNVTTIVDLSRENQITLEHSLRAGEFLGISPGSKSDFLEGIEISLRIPDPLLKSGTSFIFLIYKQVTPAVRTGHANYKALEAGNLILPIRSRIYLELPLNTPPGPEDPSVFQLQGPLTLADFPLMVAILPLSKGAPSALDTSSFQVKVTPVWGDRGKAEIILSGSRIDESSLEIWIDDQKINFSGQALILPTGIHTILARMEGAGEISRNFAVQKAQTVRVELPFEYLISTVLFEAPEAAQIFLDGEKIPFPPSNPLEIDEGEHTVLFMLGNYRVSRQFRTIPGINYKISLFLDILLQEY